MRWPSCLAVLRYQALLSTAQHEGRWLHLCWEGATGWACLQAHDSQQLRDVSYLLCSASCWTSFCFGMHGTAGIAEGAKHARYAAAYVSVDPAASDLAKGQALVASKPQMLLKASYVPFTMDTCRSELLKNSHITMVW